MSVTREYPESVINMSNGPGISPGFQLLLWISGFVGGDGVDPRPPVAEGDPPLRRGNRRDWFQGPGGRVNLRAITPKQTPTIMDGNP